MGGSGWSSLASSPLVRSVRRCAPFVGSVDWGLRAFSEEFGSHGSLSLRLPVRSGP